MKKNLFWSMLAMSGMLFVTSCSQDELVNEPAAADFVSATFTIGAEDIMGSRATEIGEAKLVNWVACNVYDANGAAMNLYEIVPFDQATRKATYNVRLAKGQDYKAAFFAYYGDQSTKASVYYNVNELHDIKILPGATSNLEERDAFSGNSTIAASELTNLGTVNKTVELSRPFAQLNLGIDNTEYVAAEKAGIVVKKSAIKVTNVYNAWDALANNIATDAELVDMEFALSDILSNSLMADANKDGVDEPYTYLALNYILAGTKSTTKSMTNVEFSWMTENGKTNNPATPFINIPIERNYRTNIIGRLLTTPAEFTITIDEEFKKPDHFENIVSTTEKTVNTYAELQAAIDGADEGQTIIKLGYSISGDVIVNQKKDVQILIDGQENMFHGSITVNGGSNWGGLEGLTLKNIKFMPTTSHDVVTIGENVQGNTSRYCHNVVIDNCKFGPAQGPASVENLVAIRAYQANDITVMNTNASAFHSFAQITGGKNIKFENIKSNCIRGISLGSATNCFVSNSKITATGDKKYGVRHNADSGTDVFTIYNCEIDAFIPVVIRRTNTTPITDYQLVFEGTNILTKADASSLHIAVSEADGRTTFEYPDVAVEELVGLPNVTITGANVTWVTNN